MFQDDALSDRLTGDEEQYEEEKDEDMDYEPPVESPARKQVNFKEHIPFNISIIFFSRFLGRKLCERQEERTPRSPKPRWSCQKGASLVSNHQNLLRGCSECAGSLQTSQSHQNLLRGGCK
jgi:hypothetical protein